ETFIDLRNQQLKNIPYPVHAYLMVPREMATSRIGGPRRAAVRWSMAAGAVVLLGVAAAVLLQRWQPSRDAKSTPSAPLQPVPEVVSVPAKDTQVALGVMLFKSLGGDGGDDWRREALRDGLNTQLSQLSRVKVYSKEFIDFLISRKGLTEIEAATQLGIRKMLSGSFVVMNGTMRIETHIVDVQTGVLEASYTTSGREADFLNLQNQVALGAISHLDLPVTDAEKQLLLAQRNTDEEALKMLLEAEGGAAPPPPGTAPPKPAPGPHSALPQ